MRCAGTCVISRAMGTGLLVPKPCAILGERGTLADGEYRRRVIAARYSISCCRCRRARTVRPCAMLRAILRRSSSENGRAYVFAAHDDEAHPHVHQSLQVRGPDGRRLNPRRQDLRRWRERFAEQLRAHGVEANATARRTRGVTQRYPNQGVAHMLARDEVPMYWRAVADAEQRQAGWQSHDGAFAASREIAQAMAASPARRIVRWRSALQISCGPCQCNGIRRRSSIVGRKQSLASGFLNDRRRAPMSRRSQQVVDQRTSCRAASSAPTPARSHCSSFD